MVLLDLSAAFDRVNHQLLLSDFSDCGVEGTALSLLESYLENREQCVAIGESPSEKQPFSMVSCGALFLVQYCSQYILVHLLFSWKLMELVITFFADDTELYIWVEDIDEAKHRLSSLLSDLKILMARRKLKLNDGKTEIIVIRGNLRNVSAPNFGEMSFHDIQLVPCESAKNLGVVFYSSLSLRFHIDSIVKTCKFHIHNLYMIKEFVNRKNIVTLVHSSIVSKVDYCNSLFIGLPNVILKKVQSVLN